MSREDEIRAAYENGRRSCAADFEAVNAKMRGEWLDERDAAMAVVGAAERLIEAPEEGEHVGAVADELIYLLEKLTGRDMSVYRWDLPRVTAVAADLAALDGAAVTIDSPGPLDGDPAPAGSTKEGIPDQPGGRGDRVYRGPDLGPAIDVLAAKIESLARYRAHIAYHAKRNAKRKPSAGPFKYNPDHEYTQEDVARVTMEKRAIAAAVTFLRTMPESGGLDPALADPGDWEAWRAWIESEPDEPCDPEPAYWGNNDPDLPITDPSEGR